jgi:hypothetical protein
VREISSSVPVVVLFVVSRSSQFRRGLFCLSCFCSFCFYSCSTCSVPTETSLSFYFYLFCCFHFVCVRSILALFVFDLFQNKWVCFQSVRCVLFLFVILFSFIFFSTFLFLLALFPARFFLFMFVPFLTRLFVLCAW